MKQIYTIALGLVLAFTASVAAAQSLPCPGQNSSHFPNLACQLQTSARTSTPQVRALPATFAAQLNQLPIATAISGSGLVFSGVIPTVSAESLGTILTQRGETLGKHKYYISFNYQHFNFETIDGIDLGSFSAVSHSPDQVSQSDIGLTVDQFTVIGSFGLTQRIDVSFVAPFSRVTFDTRSVTTAFPGSPVTNRLYGTANGIGDIAANLKANIFKSSSERTNVAIGAEVRFPTGDELNYLGSGSYGFKPYFIVSHSAKHFTPNINLGYQWNGKSDLNPDASGNPQALPSAFLYSGGVDLKVVRKLTIVGEFVGQYVLDGPRLARATDTIGTTQYDSVRLFNGNYSMNNAGVGIKFSPIRRLSINGHVLFALDDAGLRSKIIPLGGISYTF